MNMSDSESGRVTRGALKKAEKRVIEEERTEREKKRFNVGNQIGKNDIVVNTNLGKIKIENDSNEMKVEVDKETVSLTLTDSQETELEQKVVVVEQLEDIPIIKNEPLDQISEEPGVVSDYPVKEEPDTDNFSNGAQDIKNTQKSTVEDTKHEERSTADKVFEILFGAELINLKAIFACRLVCSEWFKSVDWCLGEDSLSYVLQGNYTFYDQKSLDKFLKVSKCFGSSPILGKTAKFELSHINPGAILDSAVKTFWQSAKVLLSKYGENLKLRQERLGLAPLKWYQLLEMILPLVPNLKTLEVYAEYDYELGNEERTEQENDLLNYMAGKVFPPLLKLQTLEFCCETSSIHTAIVKNTPKLETLYTNALSEETAILLGALKNLKLLRGPVCMKSLRHLNQDLEYLSLDFKNDPKNNQAPLQGFLQSIQQFKKLEQLSLYNSVNFDNEQHFGEESLKMNSVQQLYLHRFNNGKQDFPQIIDDIFKPDGLYANIASYFLNIKYLFITEDSIDNMTCTNEEQAATLAYHSDIWRKFKLLEDVILIAKYTLSFKPKRYYIMTPAIHCAHGCTWTKKGYEDFNKIGKHSLKNEAHFAN